MCGIIGYIGKRPSQPILLKGLQRLEYRGYDSCGIAVLGSTLEICKDAVRVGALMKVSPQFQGPIGIGHTRWATHGEPSRVNAHPHLDCQGKIAVVHNGIITNYETLKQRLREEGHSFLSETDTEVIPHLIEKYYDGNLEQAVELALRDVDGSYAILVLMRGESKLVAARRDSSLVIGIGDGEKFVASDVPAILDWTDRVVYVEDGDVCAITAEKIRTIRDRREVMRKQHKVTWSVEDAQRGGYEHFMLKEIHEQPKVVRDTLGEYLSREQPMIELDVLSGERHSLLLVASGTSYHAALIGKRVIEGLLGMPTLAESACEFNYSDSPIQCGAIAITQSGETADTLKAMRKVKQAGFRVALISNVVGSSASRIADEVVYTRAGPEISVGATKSFIAQLVSLYWLSLSHSKLAASRLRNLTSELRHISSKLGRVLAIEDKVKECAEYLARYENAFFIARGINFPVALEGALKLKEISYIHAEGYGAGELKHGPFALLGPEAPVVAVVGRDNTWEAMLSSLKEVKARKSPIIAVASENDFACKELADWVIAVPQCDPLFSPFVNTVVVQLLSYYAAKSRGCPIDFPRNLAKSVTVE